jgi:pimeloyl-ACP methyl ester carboxylesterase
MPADRRCRPRCSRRRWRTGSSARWTTQASLARCDAAPLLDYALREGYPRLEAHAITYPVRIVWGTHDRILGWPSAAERYRRDLLPQADWIELDHVGHCAQLDVPLEAAQLILGFTAR